MRFESHCYQVLLLDRGGYALKTPSFEVEEVGCRQRPPSILSFGCFCSSIVVLTTSFMENITEKIAVIVKEVKVLNFALLFIYIFKTFPFDTYFAIA